METLKCLTLPAAAHFNIIKPLLFAPYWIVESTLGFWFHYKLDAEAIVTRKFRTQTIQRQRKFSFKIECLLKRDASVSSTDSFTVAAALINANEEVRIFFFHSLSPFLWFIYCHIEYNLFRKCWDHWATKYPKKAQPLKTN